MQESAAKKKAEYQAKVRARHSNFANRQKAAVVPAFAKDILNASRKIGINDEDEVFAEFQANKLAAAVCVLPTIPLYRATLSPLSHSCAPDLRPFVSCLTFFLVL